jgi:NitT/TauT family transport system ATP-binding protein
VKRLTGDASFGERVEQPLPQRSLIFQEASLFPWLTVADNVAFGLSIAGLASEERTSSLALSTLGQASPARENPTGAS